MLRGGLSNARRWALAWAVLGGLTWTALERPASERPILLLVAALAGTLALPRGVSRLLRDAAPHAREIAAIAIIIATGLAFFGPVVADAGRRGDWPQNLAVVHELYDAYAQGRATPNVFLGVSAGDPTLDLYPTLPHRAVAAIAALLGSEALVDPLTMWLVVVAYIAAAVAVTRVALRFAAWLPALLAGVACLVDTGSVFCWGIDATWYWGLFPSTISLAITLSALPSALDLVREGPTRGRVATLWLLCALGPVVHPIGVVFVAVLVIAAALAIVVSKRHRVRFALVALHMGTGVLISAHWWMGQGERLTAGASHFGTPQLAMDLAVERILDGAVPESALPALMLISLLTLATTHRRYAGFVWAGAWVMLGLYLEPLFLDLGLSPSRVAARWQSYRASTVAMPLLYAAAAAVLSAPAQVPRRRWLAIATRVASIAALCAAFGPMGEAVDWGRAHVRRMHQRITEERVRDPADVDAMVAFFRTQAPDLGPDRYARALYLWGGDPVNAPIWIWDRAGVPVVARGLTVPIFVSREQLYELSPESLRRYAIRWAIDYERPPSIGDPATERRFGAFVVRELDTWDGRLAHDAGGSDAVRVEEVREEQIILRNTSPRPVLAELGLLYSPRWRGVHDGRAIRVCARPATSDPSVERVLAAWLPPGRSVLRPDGTLPSDWKYVPISLLGLALATLAWPWRRTAAWRARLASLARRWGRLAVVAAMLAVFLALPTWQGAFGGYAKSLRFGGLFGPARVTSIQAEHRRACTPDRLGRAFTCPGGPSVEMEVVETINDTPFGWNVPTPGLRFTASGPWEIEIEVPSRWAPGLYRLSCHGNCASMNLHLGGARVDAPARRTTSFEISDPQEGLRLRVRGHAGDGWLALVRADAIDLDRTSDVPSCE